MALFQYEKVNGTTTVHILQPAQQNSEYTFQIKIGFSCQTGNPHTIGFWKNQFSKALCKNGKPQVPAATLEQYLNQISSQSAIFNFTDTHTQKEKFQQALNILSRYTSSSMEAKLKAHPVGFMAKLRSRMGRRLQIQRIHSRTNHTRLRNRSA